MMPRAEWARKSIKGWISAQDFACSTSAIFACSRVSPDLYSVLYARLIARMASLEKPRRFNPSELMP